MAQKLSSSGSPPDPPELTACNRIIMGIPEYEDDLDENDIAAIFGV